MDKNMVKLFYICVGVILFSVGYLLWYFGFEVYWELLTLVFLCGDLSKSQTLAPQISPHSAAYGSLIFVFLLKT